MATQVHSVLPVIALSNTEPLLVCICFGNHLRLFDASSGACLLQFESEKLSQQQQQNKKKRGGAAAAASSSGDAAQASAGNESVAAEEDGGAGNDGEEFEANLTCAKFYATSATQFLACGSSNKKTYIFARDTTVTNNQWMLIGSCIVRKRVSGLAFATHGAAEGVECFFGDKFGDAHSVNVTKMLAQFNESNKSAVSMEPELRIGHISMLMDMCTSVDERFIFTADRDEKIRVSQYPDTYNIYNFCLGHTELVSCITTFKANSGKEILVSGSADGSLRTWDYLNIDDPLLFTLSSGSEDEQLKIASSVSALRVGNSVYILVSFEKQTSISVFEFVEQDSSLKFVDQLDLGVQVLSARIASNGTIFVLTAQPGNNLAVIDMTVVSTGTIALKPQTGSALLTAVSAQANFSVADDVTYLEMMRKASKKTPKPGRGKGKRSADTPAEGQADAESKKESGKKQKTE